jgi:hypothetical protein
VLGSKLSKSDILHSTSGMVKIPVSSLHSPDSIVHTASYAASVQDSTLRSKADETYSYNLDVENCGAIVHFPICLISQIN